MAETMKEEAKTKGAKNNGAPRGAGPVAETVSSEVAVGTPPEAQSMVVSPEAQAGEDFDYGDAAGQGFENQDMSDRKLPIIELLQSNSPEVVQSKGKVFAGQFRNSVTGEVYDEVDFVPAITDHCFTEWVPRDDGGGFRGRHPKNAKVVKEAIARNGGRSIGKLPVPQPPDAKTGKAQPQHELVETFEIYAILYDKTGEMSGFAMIPFASKKIAAYRAFNTAVSNFAPTIGGKKLPPGVVPLFAHRVKMTSISDTNAKGTFMVPVLGPAEGGDELKKSLLPKTDPRYVAAKKLHDDVRAGFAKADYETTEQDPGVDPEGDAPF